MSHQQSQGMAAYAAQDAAQHMPQQNMPGMAAQPGHSEGRAIPGTSGKTDAEVFNSADVLTAGDGLSAELCGRSPPTASRLSGDRERRASASGGSRPASQTHSRTSSSQTHSRTPSQQLPDLVGGGAQASATTGESAAAGLTGFDVNTSYASDVSGNNFSASSGGPVNVPMNAPVLNAGGVKP